MSIFMATASGAGASLPIVITFLPQKSEQDACQEGNRSLSGGGSGGCGLALR